MKRTIIESERSAVYAAMNEEPGEVLDLSEDYEASDIYAAMSEIDDDVVDAKRFTKPLVGGGAMNFVGKTVSVETNGKTVDVPTTVYVEKLENVIRRQEQAIAKLEHQVRTINYLFRSQKTVVAKTLNDLRREVDNKIDRRD